MRDLFPPDLGGQFKVFSQALTWLFGELIDQRAEEPVAFLAQLGRDHRKYGVTQSHYYSMHEALYTTLRSQLSENWDDKLDDTARAALELFIGVMRGAADAEQGPPFCDGTVVELNRVSRDISVVRLAAGPAAGLLRRASTSPCRCRSGRGAGATSARPCPPTPAAPSSSTSARSLAEWSARPIVGETQPGDRWRLSNPHGGMQIDRDGGRRADGRGQHRAGAAAGAHHGPHPVGGEPEGAPVLRRAATRASCTTCARCGRSRRRIPWLSVSPVSEFRQDPPWAADYPDVQPPRGLHVRQTGKLPEVVTRYGNWGDRQILICGGPDMVTATKEALIAKGAPAERIQHDPLAG